MLICTGNTGLSSFLSLCEFTLITILAILYTKNIFRIYKEDEIEKYEYLDRILMLLSSCQIFLLFIVFLSSEYFGISLIYEVLKFSENAIICGCLLFQIMLWQHYSVTFYLVKHYIIIMVIFDVITILCGVSFEYSFFEVNTCPSLIMIILSLIGLFFGLGIMGYAVYKNFEEKTDVSLHSLVVEDHYNLNNIFQKYANSIKKMKKYYLLIIVSFTLSYFVDIYFKLIMTRDIEDNIDNNAGIQSNYTYTNITNIYNSNTTLPANEENCSYYGNLGDEFYFKEYIICTLSFFFRDLGPHIYIFLALFVYKTNAISRSSSFIELI